MGIMIEVTVTASLLIGVVLLLRILFKNSISRRLQYALWGLVLLHLLLPISLVQAPFSVMNVVKELQSGASNVGRQLPAAQLSVGPEIQRAPDLAIAWESPERQEGEPISSVQLVREFGVYVFDLLSATQVIMFVWGAGALSLFLWFRFVDRRFYGCLEGERKPFAAPFGTLPVYLVETERAPCLYGFKKPAIYLTPQSVDSEEKLTFVLEHELTHYRHGDHNLGPFESPVPLHPLV